MSEASIQSSIPFTQWKLVYEKTHSIRQLTGRRDRLFFSFDFYKPVFRMQSIIWTDFFLNKEVQNLFLCKTCFSLINRWVPSFKCLCNSGQFVQLHIMYTKKQNKLQIQKMLFGRLKMILLSYMSLCFMFMLLLFRFYFSFYYTHFLKYALSVYIFILL